MVTFPVAAVSLCVDEMKVWCTDNGEGLAQRHYYTLSRSHEVATCMGWRLGAVILKETERCDARILDDDDNIHISIPPSGRNFRDDSGHAL